MAFVAYIISDLPHDWSYSCKVAFLHLYTQLGLLGVVSTNILPSFRADYSSKEGAVETSISEIFGGKSLDITLKKRISCPHNKMQR
jgi:hypothetical protein